jgi:hypothetical protein
MWLVLSGDLPIAALDASNKYSTLIYSLYVRNAEQIDDGRRRVAHSRACLQV